MKHSGNARTCITVSTHTSRLESTLYRLRKPKSVGVLLSSYLMGQNVKKLTRPASVINAKENNRAITLVLRIGLLSNLTHVPMLNGLRRSCSEIASMNKGAVCTLRSACVPFDSNISFPSESLEVHCSGKQ